MKDAAANDDDDEEEEEEPGSVIINEMKKNTNWRRVVYSSAVFVANRVLIIIFVITRLTHIHTNKNTNRYLLFFNVDAAF